MTIGLLIRKAIRCRDKLVLMADLTLILLAVSAIMAGLVFSDSWFRSHEGIRYLSHFGQFKDAFDSGIFYPRWMPDYYGGWGYPLFIFYQPGYFFILLLSNCLFSDLLVAGYCSLIAILFAGATGAYLLGRRISNSRTTALFCSGMFLCTPYLYVNLFVRGDLGELASMAVLPWIVFFLVLTGERISQGRPFMHCVLAVSLSSAALVFCHPFTSLLFYPAMAVLIIGISLGMDAKHRARFLLAGIASMACGAILSSPYWLPAFQLRDYVDYTNAVRGYFKPAEHIV